MCGRPAEPPFPERVEALRTAFAIHAAGHERAIHDVVAALGDAAEEASHL